MHISQTQTFIISKFKRTCTCMASKFNSSFSILSSSIFFFFARNFFSISCNIDITRIYLAICIHVCIFNRLFYFINVHVWQINFLFNILHTIFFFFVLHWNTCGQDLQLKIFSKSILILFTYINIKITNFVYINSIFVFDV